jgi:hypothetical protein
MSKSKLGILMRPTLSALTRAAVLAAIHFAAPLAHAQVAVADTTVVRTWPLHAAGQRGPNDGFLVTSLALTF